VVLQKTKIPARGLKLFNCFLTIKQGLVTSKNQNPREGIETYENRIQPYRCQRLSSKNQNPREGIETYRVGICHAVLRCHFKKPKSPRGD